MIAVIANQEKYDCLRLLNKVKVLLSQLERPYEIVQTFPFTQEDIETIASAEVYIILGGDGTILSAFTHFPTPPRGYVLAVNFGTMGYMAGMSEHNALDIIENYLIWHFSSSQPPIIPIQTPIASNQTNANHTKSSPSVEDMRYTPDNQTKSNQANANPIAPEQSDAEKMASQQSPSKHIISHHLPPTPSKQPLSQEIAPSNRPRKRFKEENRFVLFTEYASPEQPHHIVTRYALNETTIRVADRLRPIIVEVKINGASIFKVRGDGVIIATPTGSTAYNLSVGGPILSPEIEAFVLTFISAHSLTIKPIVVARGDIVELITSDRTILGIDGAIYPRSGPSIRCGLSSKPLTFVKSASDSPYHRLKQKLHWGE